MIISQAIKDVTIKGDLEYSGKMHINIERSSHLIRLLTKAYADKIGSLIRESVANAKDSHTMADIQDPVLVRITTDKTGQNVFEVEDNGLGLDEQEFHKYIMGIGESTKQQLANVIGGLK